MLNKNFFLLASSLVLLSSCGGGDKIHLKDDDSVAVSCSNFNQDVKDTVNFDFDSSELSHVSKGVLQQQADWIKAEAKQDSQFTVEGHCDIRGTKAYNLALGERRAYAAKKYLVDQGIAADQLSVVSYGSEKPLVQGSTEEAYGQNRRAVTVSSHHRHD